MMSNLESSKHQNRNINKQTIYSNANLTFHYGMFIVVIVCNCQNNYAYSLYGFIFHLLSLYLFGRKLTQLNAKHKKHITKMFLLIYIHTYIYPRVQSPRKINKYIYNMYTHPRGKKKTPIHPPTFISNGYDHRQHQQQEKQKPFKSTKHDLCCMVFVWVKVKERHRNTPPSSSNATESICR